MAGPTVAILEATHDAVLSFLMEGNAYPLRPRSDRQIALIGDCIASLLVCPQGLEPVAFVQLSEDINCIADPYLLAIHE